MNEKFTPGKWVARIEDHSFCDTGDVFTSFTVATEGAGKYDCFAEIFTRNDDIYEAAANTRLIAAAPEMYYALKHYFDLIQRADYGDIVAEQKIFEDICYIEGALHKAEREE